MPPTDPLQRRLAAFRTLLGQRILAAGLDPAAPVRVRSDIFGGIGSVKDHPQAAEIEELLANDPVLFRSFEQLVELFQRQHASSQTPSGPSPLGGRLHTLGSWVPSADENLSSIVELAINGDGVTVSVSG